MDVNRREGFFMAHTFTEPPPLIVRMTADDRQAINRMVQHKRQEFQSVMKKGIVAMLNAQEEHDKLAEKRAEYLSFLSLKTQRKKVELSQLTTAARGVTQGAPMGIDSGAQIVLGGANVVGQALLDESEFRRQEQEAEQNLYSAQMLYYIPPQDYEPIADRVATILSYRYQFLIFRLAAGENGYIKLANFFLKSMKHYAISRLREQKNNVISALINAAIPPSTDAFSYRDFPTIDLANFRVNLRNWGNRSTLAFDEEASEIVKRCGPVVRSLLGGCLTYVDTHALKIKPYHNYTIIGALNHAPIVNAAGRVMSGLQTAHRQIVSLDGNMKYPMILLSKEETTAHLGVNFATRTTDYYLEPAHFEVLKRLVPNFLSYRALYQVTKINNNNLDNFDAYRYPEERLECPWTMRRDEQLQSRLLSMYIGAKSPTVACEIQEIEGIAKLQAMLKAGHDDALQLQRQELQLSWTALLGSVRLLFNHDIPESTQKRHRIAALNQAKSAAKTVSQMLEFMLRANALAAEDFNDAKRLIGLVNLSIYACRSNLMQETLRFDEVLHANAITQEKAKQISLGHQLAFNNFQLLIDLLQSGSPDELKSELLQRDVQIKNRMIKNLKIQIRDNIDSLKTMMEVSKMIALYDTDYAKTPIDLDEAIVLFDEAVIDFRQAHQSQSLPLGKKMVDFFEEILFDASFYYQALKGALNIEGCVFVENPGWSDGLSLQDKTPAEQKDVVDKAIDQWFLELNTLCHTARENLSQYSRWSTKRQLLAAELEGLKQGVISRRDKIIASYHAMRYQSTELNDVISAYLLRAKQQDELSCLYFLAQDSGSDIQTLRDSAKRLYFGYQQTCVFRAKKVTDEIISKHERIARDLSWQELMEKATLVRRAKESLELDIRDDIELLDLAHNQIHLVHREANQIAQDMSDIDGKLHYFRDHFEFVASPIAADEKYFSLVNEKVDAILANISYLGLDLASYAEYVSLQHEKFKSGWQGNTIERTQEAGIFFLAKLVVWVNETYGRLNFIDKALQIIKNQRERVSNLVNQEPLEFLNTRKKALRAVKQAYGAIQNVNQRIEQNDMGIVVPNPIKKTDLARDVLIWSTSLSIAEREWLDFKNATNVRRQLQHLKEYKSPVRMIYSFLLTMVIDQIIQKRLDLARLRKMQNQLMKLRLGVTSLENQVNLIQDGGQGTVQDLKKRLLRFCGQKMTRFDVELEQLLVLKNQMLAQSLRLFFVEWKRKALDLPLEEIALKTKCHKFVGDIMSPLVQEESDEDNEIQFCMDDLEEMFEGIQEYAVMNQIDEKKSPRKASTFSMFTSSPSSSEESLEPQIFHQSV